MDASVRAARPPPSRRALFQSSSRRQQPTSVVRPDTVVLQQPMDDDLVERDEKGQYIVTAPSSMYKHLAQMQEGADEETERENQLIELYGKQNAHWDPKAVEEEIKAALKSSGRRAVASLQQDKWMFEGGSEQR